MNYPDTIKELIECFSKLPSIGNKTAERLALSTIEMSDEVINLFSESLKNIKTKIKKCDICNNYTEDDICSICNNNKRNKEILCIVENPKDIDLIEKNNIYDGYYFVLKNLISPSNGLDSSSIELDRIIDLIKNNKVKEVIIAIKPNIEGETTSLYISKLLEQYDVIVSRIALGIPMGADIDYVDSLTLEMALENRKIISSK